MTNMDNSTKIPFKVSARTARLIGRENIASSKGAIIELVKNGYDADSKISVVYFDNKFSVVHNEITEQYLKELVSLGVTEAEIFEIYERDAEDENKYIIKSDIVEDKKKQFKNLISKHNSLYIIDAGDGMTQNIIRDYWMTIGTDNKANDVFTKSGRVKAGAKGIGRFALDKLGGICEMTTIFNPNNHNQDTDIEGNETGFSGYKWNVNWEDFEGEFKTIDKVNAELLGIHSNSITEEIKLQIPELDLSKINLEEDTQYGTILKISNLRDNWEDFYVDQVFSDLEVLVPPKEVGEFEIYLFSSLDPNKYGEVAGSICDDYDYKLVAKADEHQNVFITVYREEYDVELIPNNFFIRSPMQNEPYKKTDFQRGFWKKETTFSQLLSGFKERDEDNTFNNIGVFEFTFYFLKRSFTTDDAKRFFYKSFMSNNRKDWLNKFGGIKLFRDNFRVRPYGEIKDASFDWLSLGNRKANSPAGVAKVDGGYRVEPENVAGAVKISRLTNVNFEDKSSREGLQNNKTFDVFKQLLAGIINVFEEDRAFIAREMDAFDDEQFGAERDRKKAEELAKKIVADSREKRRQREENPQNTPPTPTTEAEQENEREKEILAIEIERKEEQIEKLKDEQKVLRGLASSGIVLASFSHDLSKLNDVLSSRTDKLKELISNKIKEDDYKDIEKRKNPFSQIERIRKQDIKLQNWLNFSLGATRKDKRKRPQVFLKNYFSEFKEGWATVLEERGVLLDIEDIENIELRIFEIDLDSIFNNLLVNSIEAFNLMKENRQRQVQIRVYTNGKGVIFDYFDNGIGLSKDIEKADIIFEPLFTTRRNPHTAEEEGTGLGMWLVKSIVKENDGDVKLLFPEIGFGLRISFPIKYKRQKNEEI
ncbi:TPA: GHKL domain-containing protein [Elizabethkingia meningoseptica]|nr:GHKL domain-containing protein [Elizabethkingia meningoseptica]